MSVIPMDHACGRGIVLEVQPPLESLTFYQQAEQPPSDRLPHRHQPDHQSPHSKMDSADAHHQCKHSHHHHHHHHHHIEQQPFPHHQFHHLPVAGPYLDSSSGLITSDVNSMSCDILPHSEKEKQGLSQNLYADQCTGISVQMSFQPPEDGYVSFKAHEEGHLPSTLCEDMHTVPGRHENLHFLSDGRYLQCQLYPPASSSVLVIPRVRLLCSIGGRIMGRPVDGKLRYCGGDTRLIGVEHGIRFSDFTAKLSRMYGPGLILKYQLPGEDLDALVSVSSDEDLQNMLDEYYKMVANGNNSWFRLFLFRNKLDLEASTCFDFSHGRTECRSQIMQRYVEAINGFDVKGVSEQSTDVIVENSSNGRPSIARGAFDNMHTTLAGSCLPMKAFLSAPPASPSVPSSPSGAPRQTHCKQCGTGDTCLPLSKEQQNPMMPMNGLDTTASELAQEQHVDVLKCDHNQSHIPGECTKMQQDPPYRRCDAPWVKENAMCLTDTEECRACNHEWQHQRTGTAHVDALCGISKACGPVEPQREAHCEYHVVSQPLTTMACQGGQVDNAGYRCEPPAHCYVEGHKQLLYPHHLQQTGSQLPHWASLIRSQKGPDVGPICKGLPHFIKEPVHFTSSASAKTLGSAPSSPRNVGLGRCCCCHQHFQVDRGINVSLGEHSHSQKPSYLEDHMIRRHGVPPFSGFSDGQDVCFDPGVPHSVPTLEKGLEIDEQEYDAFSRKQALSRNNTVSHLSERSAKENGASSLMESMHRLQEGGPPQYQICCPDLHTAKGQQLVKARVFSTPEGQVFLGQFDPYSGNHIENITSRRPTHDLKSDTGFERANDTVTGLIVSNGQGILSVPNAHGASGYAHVHGSSYSPVAGHQESKCNLSSESFSSTDAIAGSLSSISLEHTAWVDSPSPIRCDDQSKVREVQECFPPGDHMVSSRHLVDGIVKHETLGETSRTPSFDCKDCHAKVGSIKSSANATEPKTEICSVLSLNPVTEKKVSTLTEDKTGVSHVDGSQSKFDDKFCPPISLQSFSARMLDSDAFRASAALAMPFYDQSPISSISNAPCFSAHVESKTVSLEEEAREPCANINSPLMASLHQNHGQYQEMAKTDVESTPRTIMEHETKTVSEQSRSNSKPSSRHCSIGSEVQEKPLETVSVAQSRETKQIAQEVNVSGPVDACPEDDEKELPATQAETEAIARGLQIIKNDDLEDLKELGSGTYGTVYHGKWRGSDVAIKRIKPSCFMGSPSQQERLISDFWREAGTLSQLHHPNIVAFYGVVPDGPEGTLATVTEYMVNGSLKQVLVKKDRTIDRRKRLLIAMDAAFGMEYLHSKRIVHFDLKSENLLVNMRDAHRPICKVGDFGLSKVKHQTLVSGGVRGTLPWMAPELLDTKGRVTEKVDVYSFGIVMWELLTGEEPYAKMHCGTIIGGIVHNNLRPVIPSWCDPSWRDLMERCWSGNPADRPDFPTVANELRAIASSMNVK